MDEQIKQSNDEDIEYQIDEQESLPAAKQVESLIHQAKNYKILLKKFKKQPSFSRPYYFILSAKWLRRWKLHVSYQQSVSAALPNKFLGRGRLPTINENIIKSNSQITACFQPQLDYLNIVLKGGLEQQNDYVFLTQQMWQMFSKYDHYEVKRFVEQTRKGKQVQIYYKQVNLVPIFSDFLKQIQDQKTKKLMHLKLQVSHYIQVQRFQDIVRGKLKDFISVYHYTKFSKDLPVRMWLMPENTRQNILVNVLINGCRTNETYTYKLFSQGHYMRPDKKVCDFGILGTSLILVEMLQQQKEWAFWNHMKPFFGQCDSCKQKEELKHACSCKYVLYCSKKCKSQGKNHHKIRCPNQCQSDQEDVQITLNEHSRLGLVGLINLGNTCFMNSGLQCLSHIYQLTEYFLENKYLRQINKQNPEGTGGQLSRAYAKMLKGLWLGGQSSISPTQLKRAIVKFQPMFLGSNQHDSGQLVTCLLDGLHEDLNKVIKKPCVQTKNQDGRPDFIVAKQSWQNYLKRNKSVIVDLIVGQFKSILDCPICRYKSVQFDSFSMCTLPIVNDNLKKFEVTYLKDHLYMTVLTICHDATWRWKMSNVFQDVKKKLGLDVNDQLVSYVTSYSVCELINETQSVQQVQKQHKYRHIFIRKLVQGQNPKTDVAVSLVNVICHSSYGSQSYRKNIASYRLYFFSKEMTRKQVHNRIYSYYKQLYPVQNYEQEVINVPESQQPFRLLTLPGSKFNNCEYCHIKSCDGCVFAYDQKQLNALLGNQKKKMEMELYWRKNDKEICEKLQEIKQNRFNDSNKESKIKSGTNIQECFKLFGQPQILAQDNDWYCPECKDFVLAKKQMQIYKAPKVLILYLKRFKRNDNHTQKYNIMVEFPVKNLDLSGYVTNHNLPEQYSKGQTQENTQKQPLLYDLVGIVNHFGGTAGGHYTAYCLDPHTQKWYEFDDSRVNQLKSAQDAITQNAYMLYYKRKE